MKSTLKLMILLTLFVFSCSQEEAEIDPAATSLIIESSSMYSIDDLINAGWKKDREFDNSEYPETIEIAYGFFQRKKHGGSNLKGTVLNGLTQHQRKKILNS